jgi:hypothetical protein
MELLGIQALSDMVTGRHQSIKFQLLSAADNSLKGRLGGDPRPASSHSLDQSLSEA